MTLWWTAVTLSVYGLIPGGYSITDAATGEPVLRGVVAGDGGLLADVPQGHYVIAPDTLLVPACPDLVVRGAQYSGWTVCGLPAEVRVEVANQGADPAAASMTAVYVDGEEAGRAMVSAIPAGASRWTAWIALQPKPPPGQHVVSWCADVEGEVAEADEENNCAAQ